MKEEWLADDTFVIPEYIMKMTSEERMAEIERILKEDGKIVAAKKADHDTINH